MLKHIKTEIVSSVKQLIMVAQVMVVVSIFITEYSHAQEADLDAEGKLLAEKKEFDHLKDKIHKDLYADLLNSVEDIEAHRCFVYAMKHDQNCIGPYIGLLMLSTEQHNPSFMNKEALSLAVLKLKDKKQGGEYVYSKQERLYAEVAINMAEGIRKDQIQSMEELVKAYPMDFQALIMKEVRLPMVGKGNTVNESSQFVASRMKKYPLVPLLWAYWLSIHQFQNDPLFLKNEVLPFSSKLVKWAPDMPVWYLYHGMFLHKAEEYKKANESLEKAITLYREWGKNSNIPDAMNVPLLQTLIFKSVNYAKWGKFDEGIKLAKELQNQDIDFTLRNEIRGVYLWEIQSLPSRLYLARNQPGDLIRARSSLPSRELLKSAEEISAAPMYYSALNEYIAFRIAIKDGQIEAAQEIKLNFLDISRQNFDQTNVESNNFVDDSYFRLS